MKTTVKQRLIEYLKYKSIGQNRFEKATGLSIGYISKLRIEPSPTKLRSIINAATDLNQQWLLTGEGPMLVQQAAQDTGKKALPDIPSNAVPSEAIDIEYAGENRNGGIFYRDKNSGKLFLSVPHVPYAARGEFPNLADSLEPNSEWGRETYEVDKKVNGRYFSFEVRGDSMDNGMRKSLQDGDKVLVRELELDNWRTLRAGDHRFWILVFGSSVLIKEISSFDGDTGVVTCHSLNPSPEYHDFSLSLDDVRYLYYVIKIKPHEINAV